MKNIKISRNLQKGVDITFFDQNATVQIESGNREDSLQFWKYLKATADQVVNDLSQKPAEIHVVLIGNRKGKVVHKSYKS